MSDAKHWVSSCMENAQGTDVGSFTGVSGMHTIMLSVFEGTTPEAQVANISLTVDNAEVLVKHLRKAIAAVKFNVRTGRTQA